ncbi:ABC transporter permease [Lampropedia puyangensis]|uniref:ABC transporter permease n=1 Tax=Lampropedia puyangensis TaxID=1330072 RepID=A0A4S8EZ69_9BURK|nr:ABC transporter permease [Lampropedia puyangensis]THT98091.1 ABC transporter permease [Lampropedia puyangensis]
MTIHPTVSYLLKRLAQAVPTCLLIVLLSFVLLQVAPGDMADVVAAESGASTQEYMDELRQLYGLDVPAHQQFFNYLRNLARLDLGYSHRENEPIAQLILDRVPATLTLALFSTAFAAVFGVLLGVLAAKYRGTWLDTAISTISSIGFATPMFWVGLMLIVVFSIHLRWFSVGGMSTVGREYAGWFDYARDVARHVVLPGLSLGFFYMSIYVRTTRSAMLEVYGHDFVRTARAKGVGERRILFRHILRNALLPIVTLTGVEIGGILGGTVVIETVFSWPGIGRLAYDAVLARDLNLLLGIFLCSSALVVITNLVVDLIYVLIDPRIEVAK